MEMKRLKILFLIIIFIYIITLTDIFISGTFYHLSRLLEERAPHKALGYAQLSIKLNPINSSNYLQKYRVLRIILKSKLSSEEKQRYIKETLKTLKKAIELEPVNPSYHMYYALALLKYEKKRPAVIELIKSELMKAKQLKPYSPLYQKIADTYIKVLSGRLKKKGGVS